MTIYDNKGVQLGAGVTNSKGIWQGAVAERERYSQVFAVLGAPGDVPDGAYFAIIAGGIGSRLFPLSTNARPKQFLDLLIQLLGQHVHLLLVLPGVGVKFELRNDLVRE